MLDWYHAVEHLREVARAHFGDASDLVTPWVKTREGELYDGKAKAVAALAADFAGASEPYSDGMPVR